ncbi:hypothetical protein DYI37_01455 [Fulvimarina endophytica]|uniref:Uncharacterized protein n=1 Tax=Fulvimarina endophytica TaxID=2293836 RepID=A0A371XA91_9HYPH|nr:hypothetical protein [Fulvimarina endophytica]RFC66163.1 hypothetical protein DYI37_01455 [Fulvimarina endophytica]
MRRFLRLPTCVAAIALAVAATISAPASAQKWPKAEIDAYARSFAGKTYVMSLGGLGNTLVYAAPDGRAYVVRAFDKAVVPGSWEISYSMSNRSLIACVRRSSVKQCATQALMAQSPSRRGDVFALSQRRALNRVLSINFDLAEAARAAR